MRRKESNQTNKQNWSAVTSHDKLFMPPTLKKLKGQLALGLSVRASMRASVRLLQV